MPGLDYTAILLVGIILLVVVGPEDPDGFVRKLGQLYGQLRRRYLDRWRDPEAIGRPFEPDPNSLFGRVQALFHRLFDWLGL